jgi:hypothetical protein
MRVELSLARFHGLRLLRHPIIPLGVIGSVVVFWLATRETAPVLDRDGIVLAGSCLLLAALALIVADFAVRRDRREEVHEMLAALPTSADRRALGHALGGWSLMVASLLVVVAGVGWMYLNRPVGSIPWWELAGAPAVVLLGFTAGIAVGRWLPTPLAAPVVVVGLAAWFMVPILFASTSSPSPYFPWFANDAQVPQAFPRMAAVHAAYVMGLTVVLIGVAARRWKLLAGAGMIVVISAAALSSIPVGSQRDGLVDDWLASQAYVCQDRNEIEYCVVSGYEPWIDRWAEVADGVAVVAPIAGTTLRQGLDADLGFSWNTEGWMARSLAQALVRPALNIPIENTVDLSECTMTTIGVSGQARGVVMEVVAATATPATEEDFRREVTALDRFGLLEEAPSGPRGLSGPETLLALQIVDLPREQMWAMLRARWGEVADPQTTTAELARWFDLPTPDIPPAPEYVCECHSDGSMECTAT